MCQCLYVRKMSQLQTSFLPLRSEEDVRRDIRSRWLNEVFNDRVWQFDRYQQEINHRARRSKFKSRKRRAKNFKKWLDQQMRDMRRRRVAEAVAATAVRNEAVHPG